MNVIRILPLHGIEGLKLGASENDVIAWAGEPNEKRLHPDQDQATTLHYSFKGQMYGLDSKGNLNFIVIRTGKCAIELWGSIIDHDASGIRNLILKAGFEPKTNCNSFGDSIEVAEQGLCFCFDTDSGDLEAVQIYPIP